MMIRRIGSSGGLWSDTLHELDQLRREMDRVFDSFGGTSGFGWSGGGLPWSGVLPAVNVTQDDDRYYIRAAFPGVRPSELSIAGMGNRITISGKRETLAPESGASYHRRERGEGSYSRAIDLPTDIDSSRAEAVYSDGIVTIKVPRAESARPRQIAVRSG